MNDTSLLEQAQKICRNLLDLDPPETAEKINDAIKKVATILPLNDRDRAGLFERLIESTGVTQQAPRILENQQYQPWVLDRWATHNGNRKFWKRYRDYLIDDKKISSAVISRLDDLTDKILDRLADPNAHDQFDKRGLVVGHVQSGKTSNYVGLITKAADAGYKLIVVLAGIHSTLRSQTQLRIDEGFLGYDTATSRSFDQNTNRIGVGRIDPNVPAHSLTSSELNGDFRRNVAETINLNLRGSDPVIIVIKKNNAVLKNLIQWLSAKVGETLPGSTERIVNNVPLLLVDDEADNASINISKSSVSSINGAIRALLQLFRKSAYVGYTATPYANVFIPPPEKEKDESLSKGVKIVVGNGDYNIGEDLFPRDFIVNIPPPSNYIGPEKFFGIVSEDNIYENAADGQDDYKENSSPIHLFEPVDDYQPKEYFDNESIPKQLAQSNSHYIPDGHKKDDSKPDDLPQSLKRAVQYFILSCAARRVRGQINAHNSMLVHVTRFVTWQNHIAFLINETLNDYRNKIEFKDRTFLNEMRDIWEMEFKPKTEEILSSPDLRDAQMSIVSWNELEVELISAVTKVKVRAVHGSTLLGGLDVENIQALDYYENRRKGLSVIAVGGNKLSRGLTLEGLTISYYLRASKMYDTLMQMGRWFGYRPGYLDLCRLFTSNDLVSHYKHITAATEEMRAEFDRMWILKKQPIDYGLKVRAHSGVLAITASNKFRYKKMMSFSFSGGLEETWQFDKRRKDIFESNFKVTEKFLGTLGTYNGAANKSKALQTQPFVWKEENNYRQIVNFLGEYISAQSSFHTGLLKEYIEKQAGRGNLINWTVALITNTKATPENTIQINNVGRVGLSFRKDDSKDSSQYFELSKAHIIGSFHEYIDLDNEQLQQAFDQTRNDKIEQGLEAEMEHPSPLRIRKNRSQTNGLLLIYPLNPRPKESRSAYSTVPIIGLALSFPYIENDLKVVYAINETFQSQLYEYAEEMDLEDLDTDDEFEEKVSPLSQSSLSSETFLSLIENKHCSALEESEFFSGIVPRYPQPKEDINRLRKDGHTPIFSNDDPRILNRDVVAFYSESDIQQYYLKDSYSKVLLTEDAVATVTGSYVVGLKRSKYVTFCTHNTAGAFSDSCWIIKSARFPSSYLVAVLNSTMFGAWVRVKGEQKKETYFIKNEVLYSFPIVMPSEETKQCFTFLYDLVFSTGIKEQTANSAKIKSYLTGILDALVFCEYFPASLHTQSMAIYKSLASFMVTEKIGESDGALIAQKLHDKFYDRKHPVREALFFLENQNKIARIKSVFTK